MLWLYGSTAAMAPYFPKCAVPDGKGRPQYLDGARPATSCGTNWNHFCRQISARQVAWLQENCCADIVRGTRWNPLRRPTSRLVLGLQRAMELGVCVADTGRGTRWNPLRRPTVVVVWLAQGHGNHGNPKVRGSHWGSPQGLLGQCYVRGFAAPWQPRHHISKSVQFPLGQPKGFVGAV